MKRAEAQKLLNKPVSAWTATHGVYSGILLELVCRPRKPWRGKVRITALTDAQGASVSRQYSPGTVIEVGGCSISAEASNEVRDGQT